MSLFAGERPTLGPIIIKDDGTAALITFEDYLGNITGTLGGTSQGQQAIFSPIISSATPANIRAVDAEPTITGTSVAVTGSIAAIRGNTTVSAATTITSGFTYGVQGKLTVKGTMSSANFSAGLVGQLDLSSAVALGTGPIAAIWADMGATMSAGAISGESVLDAVLITNTAPGTTINSAIHIETLSTYLFDLSNASYSPWFHVGAPTTLSGSLKIKTSAGDRYIAVYTTQ